MKKSVTGIKVWKAIIGQELINDISYAMIVFIIRIMTLYLALQGNFFCYLALYETHVGEGNDGQPPEI